MIGQAEKVYNVLKMLSIDYEQYNHAPVSTMEEIDTIIGHIEDIHCKNLFLRNSKGDKHYLLLVKGTKSPDLKKVAKTIGSTRLSFGSKERLKKYLGVEPGAVSPLGLINDNSKEIKVLIDKNLEKFKKITFHPNVNIASVTMEYTDFLKFLNWCQNPVEVISIS